jgi:uncharacterized membrane protein YhaH (DUF805 family)
MPGYFETMSRSLSGIARFSGRDTLSQFWPYAGTVIGITMIAGPMVFIPAVASTMSNVQQFAAEHPDQVDIASGPGFYSISVNGSHPELVPDLAGLSVAFILTSAVAVALLASAVVRRLHDRGKSAYWALPTLILLILGYVGMSFVFAQIGATDEPDMALFGLIFVNNILSLASLAALLTQLVQNGTKGPNLYGEDPRG